MPPPCLSAYDALYRPFATHPPAVSKKTGKPLKPDAWNNARDDKLMSSGLCTIPNSFAILSLRQIWRTTSLLVMMWFIYLAQA